SVARTVLGATSVNAPLRFRSMRGRIRTTLQVGRGSASASHDRRQSTKVYEVFGRRGKPIGCNTRKLGIRWAIDPRNGLFPKHAKRLFPKGLQACLRSSPLKILN